MKTLNNLPVYKADIVGMNNGIYNMSLVEWPAVETPWLKFSGKEKQMKFAVASEEQRKVFGVMMRADFPIYRIDPEMGEYYIVFNRDVIERATRKFLATGSNMWVNLEHNPDAYVDGVQLEQIFIKDERFGLVPKGFEDITDGSLFGVYKIENEGVWDAVKRGDFNGFSIEGYFTLIGEKEDEPVIDSIEDLLDKLGLAHK